MILIEPATVVTLDAGRRILADGSVLVQTPARQPIARAGLAIESKWPVVP